jgi:hypothetical protein
MSNQPTVHHAMHDIRCPFCCHVMTDDEMCRNQYLKGSDGDDLYGIAPREERTHVVCPNVTCGKGYYVQGGYIPKYTCAATENELD